MREEVVEGLVVFIEVVVAPTLIFLGTWWLLEKLGVPTIFSIMYAGLVTSLYMELVSE